jgi:hypothetical protein
MSQLDRDADNAAAPAFDDLAADDGVFGPVSALDEDVRLNGVDQSERGVFSEYDDAIHACEGLENLGSLLFRIDGTALTFVRSDRSVGVEPDDQRVAQAARVLQVTDVARVQQIEHAIREDDDLPDRAKPPDERNGVSSCHC